MRSILVLVATLCILTTVTLGLAVPSAAAPSAQTQCFVQTGFCIDEPAFQHYFADRGGARILGFPVSRAFRLEGFTVQFFQRVVLQLQGDTVARLNLLDPGNLPVTHANQSVFPPPDPGMAVDAPRPDDPAYSRRVVEYVQSVSPDTWNGQPVGFATLFNSTVPANDVSTEIRTLLNLEIWGLPTSRPTIDPGNASFIYQRFQRGIMHYRVDCACTEGILVGDYLKAVMTGKDLPSDLSDEMRGSRFFAQYTPDAAGWVARPTELSSSDLSAAFEPGDPGLMPAQLKDTPTSQSAPTSTPRPPTSSPTASPLIVPSPTPIPGASLSITVNPALADLRVLLLPLSIEAVHDTGGAYHASDIPPGDHQVYAMSRDGKTSDPYLVTLRAGDVRQLSMALPNFSTGLPVLYMGRVVDSGGGRVNKAMVWRIGGAGITRSEADGTFHLVDAFDDAKSRSPTNVTFVASSGDHWGYLAVDLAKSVPLVEVKLTRQGKPPTGPRQELDLSTNTASKLPHKFDSGNARYFTAYWPDDTNGSHEEAVEFKDFSGDLNSSQSQTCLGMCDAHVAVNIRVTQLPQGTSTLALKPGVVPNWKEAQVVTYR